MSELKVESCLHGIPTHLDTKRAEKEMIRMLLQALCHYVQSWPLSSLWPPNRVVAVRSMSRSDSVDLQLSDSAEANHNSIDRNDDGLDSSMGGQTILVSGLEMTKWTQMDPNESKWPVMITGGLPVQEDVIVWLRQTILKQWPTKKLV